MNCKVCGNSEQNAFTLIYSFPNFQVFSCNQCNFHFIPESFTSNLTYDHFKSEKELETVRRGNDWLKIERHKLRIRYIMQFKKTGHLFDLGAGWGHFLEAARLKGFTVSGVEVSKHQYTYASQDLKLPVSCIDFFDYSAPPESFDIITMWDVLEHIEDTRPALQKINTLLRKDGLLVIQVPQIDSYISKKTKENWSMLSPTHVNYFSFSTLSKLLRDNGFKVIDNRSSIELKLLLMYVIYPWIQKKKGNPKEKITSNERQGYFNKVTSKPRWLLKIAIPVHNLIYNLLSKLKIGEEIIIVAQKTTIL